MGVAVVPRIIPMVVGDAVAKIPIDGPAKSPTEGYPGAVGHERFVKHHGLLNVDDLRVILWHVDDLWVGWLDPDEPAFPDAELLVVVGQHPLGISLGSDQLDPIVDVLLLKVDRLAQGGGPVNVLRHQLDDIPKLHERDDRRIPVLDGLGWRFF
jgi:hypothetical protein